MYSFAKYKEQYKLNLRLALPVMLTQLGQITVHLADNIMVGQYGGDDPTPLAAVSFGNSVFFIMFAIAIGITLGLTPLVGELYARSEHKKAAKLLHNGLIFYTLLGISISVIQYATMPLLYHLGQPVEVVDMAIPFYRMLTFAMPFILIFFALKQFLEGVGNTKVEMVITIIMNAVSIALNWLLIYGRFGLPEMGAEGAGLGTLLARILAAALMLGFFLKSVRYSGYMQGFSLRQLSRKVVGKLLRIGLPISLQMFLEFSAFIGTSIMMGWLGKEAIGANQIALTVGNCAFMIILSVSISTTIRTSHCYGARNIDELSLASKASYHIMIAFNLLFAIIFVALRGYIPLLFTTNPEVIAITSTLMIFVALYQLSDGLQTVSIGILRGIQDVKIIMPIAFISYWLLNLPVGYLFGFTLNMGASGLFVGYLVGLTAAAIMLTMRVRRRVGRLRTAK